MNIICNIHINKRTNKHTNNVFWQKVVAKNVYESYNCLRSPFKIIYFVCVRLVRHRGKLCAHISILFLLSLYARNNNMGISLYAMPIKYIMNKMHKKCNSGRGDTFSFSSFAIPFWRFFSSVVHRLHRDELCVRYFRLSRTTIFIYRKYWIVVSSCLDTYILSDKINTAWRRKKWTAMLQEDAGNA